MSDKKRIEPELLEDNSDMEEGEDAGNSETASFEELIDDALTYIFDSGLPIRFFASAADPFVQSFLEQQKATNRILADISISLRAMANKDGANLPEIRN